MEGGIIWQSARHRRQIPPCLAWRSLLADRSLTTIPLFKVPGRACLSFLVQDCGGKTKNNPATRQQIKRILAFSFHLERTPPAVPPQPLPLQLVLARHRGVEARNWHTTSHSLRSCPPHKNALKTALHAPVQKEITILALYKPKRHDAGESLHLLLASPRVGYQSHKERLHTHAHTFRFLSCIATSYARVRVCHHPTPGFAPPPSYMVTLHLPESTADKA